MEDNVFKIQIYSGILKAGCTGAEALEVGVPTSHNGSSNATEHCPSLKSTLSMVVAKNALVLSLLLNTLLEQLWIFSLGFELYFFLSL